MKSTEQWVHALVSRRGFALSGLLVLILAVSACFGGGNEPTDNFYRLQVPEPAVQDALLLPGVVEVGLFGAEGLAGDRALLYSYRRNPDQVLRYSYHFWTESPPVLVRDQLVHALRGARVASEVVTSDLRVPPDYIIEGRLRRFEQIAGERPAVVVEADMGVVRVHGNELVMLKTYRVEEPANSAQVPDAVAAFQAALGEVFGHFVADLAQHRQFR